MKNLRTFEEFNTETPTNEGIVSGLVKGYSSISLIIKNFKKLFNKIGRKELTDGLKLSNRIIDFVFFIKENQALLDGSLDNDDIDMLSKKYDIDKKHTSEIDIVEIMYNDKFKRKLKSDLKYIIDEFNDDKNMKKLYNDGDVNKIKMYKELRTFFEEFNDFLK
ncbi:MAG: hypothetical protein WDA02_10430 [Saccharofermentanales bacterium]